MKKIIAILTLLTVFAAKTNAQDTIITMKDERILAKVESISPEEIKYKKADFIDGPSYIQRRSDIRMIIYSNGKKEIITQESKPEKKEDKITVKVSDETDDYYGSSLLSGQGKLTARGSKYTFQGKRINEKKLHSILTDTKDKQLIALVGKAKDNKKMQYIGFAAIPLSLISLVTWASAYTYYPGSGGVVKSVNRGQVAASGVIALTAVACPVISVRAKIKRKSYNAAAVKLYNQKF